MSSSSIPPPDVMMEEKKDPPINFPEILIAPTTIRNKAIKKPFSGTELKKKLTLKGNHH